ncbi:hypothetical protein CQW23_13145 [Capsicum baccatum]|uniref:tRNA(Phe) 7-[(3-amino-3-carboxypropyl)-4-demethylwyosine(37)-N(4)]-methyltransferase n=1 Tax=Capsicum baccatum TaxID=33114 RepID=A0A2G2WUM0_CAPBA|nr:hypothetical protein CQW23_13145 [Capsicum baccatum]
MEVPLGDSEKLMVDEKYVEYLVELANEKMEANRRRTDSFLDVLLKNGFSGSKISNGEFLDNGKVDCESELLENSLVNGVDGNGNTKRRDFDDSCSVDNKKVLIFGGFGGIGRHARRNDSLLLDLESGRLEVIDVLDAPCPRVGHTSSVIGNSMYVIGGRADPSNILNDWRFPFLPRC